MRVQKVINISCGYPQDDPAPIGFAHESVTHEPKPPTSVVPDPPYSLATEPKLGHHAQPLKWYDSMTGAGHFFRV